MPVTNSTSPSGGHLARAGLAIHGSAFEEDGRHDVVPAADIGQQFGQQVVAAMRLIPEMVVRIDDRQIRFQRRLGALRQPCGQGGIIADGGAAVLAFGVSDLGHSVSSLGVVSSLAAPRPPKARYASWSRASRRSDYAQATVISNRAIRRTAFSMPPREGARRPRFGPEGIAARHWH